MSTEHTTTGTDTEPRLGQPRTISVPHLVFGLVFLGIAAVWSIGEASSADLPRIAVGFPAVLILAGVVGLVAAVVNNRRRSRVLSAQSRTQQGAVHQERPAEADVADTTTVIEEK